MLQTYATNAPLRAAYLKMNAVTHFEIWDSPDDDGYQIALCSAEGVGFPESPVFGTPGQCVAWLRKTCRCTELSEGV